MGTKFTVYDHGVSPAKAQGLLEKAHARQELAAICYVSATPPRALPGFCARARAHGAARARPSHARSCLRLLSDAGIIVA